MGLDAGERPLRSAARYDHHARLAGNGHLDAWPHRRHQPDHVRLGNYHDSDGWAEHRPGGLEPERLCPSLSLAGDVATTAWRRGGIRSWRWRVATGCLSKIFFGVER